MKPEEPKRLPIDDFVEDRVIAKLKQQASSCPDALWENLKQELLLKSEPKRVLQRYKLFRSLTVAAGVLLVIGLFCLSRLETPVQAMEIVVHIPQDVAAYKESIAHPGNRTEVEAQLKEAGFDVAIGDIQAYNKNHAHYVQLHGIDHVTVDGESCPCMRLAFTCCGQPVVSYVVKADIDPNHISFKNDQTQVKQAENSQNGYRIITFSKHPTQPVQTLVSE